jgi:hypothetical protein
MIYLARYTSVAAGVLNTLLVYHLGQRAYNRITGIGAAIIFGLTFLPTREAHFAVSDAPVALAVTLTLYFCLNMIKYGRWTDYFWTGVMFGLATATKYSAGLLAFTIGTAHLLSYRYDSWTKRFSQVWLVLMAGGAGLISFLLVSPYTLLKWDVFLEHFGSDLQAGQRGFAGLDLDPAGGAAFYLKGLIWGVGWPLFLLFLGAILFALWRRQRADLMLLTLPLIGFFYMQRQEMHFVRWLMPLIPPMAVLSAETIHTGVKWLIKIGHGKQFQIRWSVASITIGLIILATLPSTFMAIRADYLLSQSDTRTQALAWIRQNIPPGSHLAAEVLSPPWGPPLAMPGLNIGPYKFAPVPTGGAIEVDFEQFQAWQVEYVITSSYYYARPLEDKTHQAKNAARLQTLDEKAKLVALFQPYSRKYQGFFYHDQVYGPANDTLYRAQPGPIIRIYRLP